MAEGGSLSLTSVSSVSGADNSNGCFGYHQVVDKVDGVKHEVNGFPELRIVEQLNARIVEAKELPTPARHMGAGERNIFCLVKMDKEEVFQSSLVSKCVNPVFGDDFSREIPRSFRQLHFYLCEQYSGRVPRPFARVSMKRTDVLKYSGQDIWLELKPFNRHSEITGKICIELSYEECLSCPASSDQSMGLSQRVKLRVLDFSDLSLPAGSARPVSLYALVTLQTGGQRLQTQKLTMPINQHRKSKFRYYLKPRNSSTSEESSSAPGANLATCPKSDIMGYLRLRMTYTVDHVLRTEAYTELWQLLLDSVAPTDRPMAGAAPGGQLIPTRGAMKQFRLSPAGLLEFLPGIQLEKAARSLLKVQIQAEQLRILVRLAAANEMAQCEDVNTLFRSSSLTSKLVYELIKFVGHNYLLTTLKPCIDKIYSDKRDCEINPTRMGSNQNLEENTEPRVARTLALASKILQRLSNYVVCGHELTSKEWWMQGVLDRFSDQHHKLGMTKFLDRISCMGGENSISGDSVSILKEGFLIQRYPREKKCLKLSWMTSKRRYFCLTELELCWGKNRAECSKNRVFLSEISVVQGVDEERFHSKHVFQVGNDNTSLFLQAANTVEMYDWTSALRKQCKRQMLAASNRQAAVNISQLYEIDLDKELESIHLLYLEHAETLRIWKNLLEGNQPSPPDSAQLEIPERLLSDPPPSPGSPGQGGSAGSVLKYSLDKLLSCVFTLERLHQESVSRVLKDVKFGSKDNPIGDDNYLLLKSRAKGIFGAGSGGGGGFCISPPDQRPNGIVESGFYGI